MANLLTKLKDKALEYLQERYLGDKAAENVVKDIGSVYTGYKSYEDQKKANEAMEQAYQEYTKDKAESQETINAALALGLQPMTVSNQPTTKAEITDFTEVQDVAKGGLMSLPNKQRKRYYGGTGPDDFSTTDEMSPPFDPKEEGISIGPMVNNLIDKLLKQGVIDENTSEEELRKILDQIMTAKGPNYYNDDGVPIEQEEEILTPFDLKGEGVPIGPMVKEPETVKPSWMTEDEWLNFQYGKTQAARGGIMKLRRGGRPGYKDSNIEEFKTIDFKREPPYKGNPNIEKFETLDFENVKPYPSDHKFWELVDWEHYDKTSKDKEESINRDMKLGISWDEIKKKYNLKDFEDVSITETEREETDSGSKVKEIFEKVKEKYNSIDFKQGGRAKYEEGVGPIEKWGHGSPDIMAKAITDSEVEDAYGVSVDDATIAWQINKLAEESDHADVFPATDSDFRSLEVLSEETNVPFKEILDIAQGSNFSALYANQLAHGGRIKKAPGGIMNLGGLEKDYRTTGGFVPIGAYEKKDDVPARLSKNEFVMTADAVRAAGGGSINRGAQQMYNVMKNLEARPAARRKIA